MFFPRRTDLLLPQKKFLKGTKLCYIYNNNNNNNNNKTEERELEFSVKSICLSTK